MNHVRSIAYTHDFEALINTSVREPDFESCHGAVDMSRIKDRKKSQKGKLAETFLQNGVAV